jgi:hypothetical protein
MKGQCSTLGDGEGAGADRQQPLTPVVDVRFALEAARGRLGVGRSICVELNRRIGEAVDPVDCHRDFGRRAGARHEERKVSLARIVGS